MPLRILPRLLPKTDNLINSSTELTRYMSFPRLLDMLEGNLFFASLDSLRQMGREANDPLESEEICGPIAIAELLYGLEKLERGVLHTIGGGFSLRPLKSEEVDTVEARISWGQKFGAFILGRRAVSCWYANPFESAAMWRSFASDGVSVTVDAGQLIKALGELPDEFVMSPINYVDRSKKPITARNAKRLADLILRPYLVKGREFEHENEVRIVTRCEIRSRGRHIQVKGLVRLIKQITISPYLDYRSAALLESHLWELLKTKHGTNVHSVVRPSSINLKRRNEFHNEEAARAESEMHRRQRYDSIPL